MRNEESTKEKVYTELKVRHADATAAAFSDYTSVWRRLIIRCQKYDADKAALKLITDAEQKAAYESLNKQQLLAIQDIAAKQRPLMRDQLFAKLETLTLYFSDSLEATVSEFREWDEKQQTRTCADMPSASEFRQYQTRVLAQLKMEVRP